MDKFKGVGSSQHKILTRLILIIFFAALQLQAAK